MITNIYIDGFNFYYGALRKTPYRWVDPEHLCQLLLPKNTIGQIKYFTALVCAAERPRPARQAAALPARAKNLAQGVSPPRSFSHT